MKIKMGKLFLSLLICTLLLNCSKETNDQNECTVEFFSLHLKADMDYTTIENTFGSPDADIGSGIHIYVYTLCDSTEIWIGYTDHIMYAHHVDSNHQLLHTLI